MDKQLAYFNARHEKTGGCWLWTGPMTDAGYGRASRWSAHRLAHTLLKGPIHPSFQVDHLCSVRNCVNPEHLDMVTIAVDGARKKIRNRWRGWATHCARGHELNDMTTNWRANGTGRQCRICQSARVVESHGRNGITIKPINLTRNATLRNKHLYDLTAEDYEKAEIDVRFVEYFWQFDQSPSSSQGVTAGAQPKGQYQ